MKANKVIERDTQGSGKIFDDRSVESDYPTLMPILSPGLRVLDVGCGTGAISRGIAHYVGPAGSVVGIDHTEEFILAGRERYQSVANLRLLHADIFTYEPEEKFDLIVAARVLQWLSNPKEALLRLKSLLKPNGQLSVLDYNHQDLEWQPEPPASMLRFYQAFLQWRATAGMNNRIAEDLAAYFQETGFHSLQVFGSDEVYAKGAPNFKAKLGIWLKVAQLKQIVAEGYLEEEDRLLAMEEYREWIDSGAERMIMKLKEVRGKI